MPEKKCGIRYFPYTHAVISARVCVHIREHKPNNTWALIFRQFELRLWTTMRAFEVITLGTMEGKVQNDN